MSYTPHTWATGDVITAARLNAMEQGIAGAGGYDLVIKLDAAYVRDLTDADLHLVEGSYASAIEKVIAGNPITAYVYASEILETGECYFHLIPILSIYADTGYHNAIEIRVLEEGPSTVVRDAAGSGNAVIYNATTTVPKTIYITESGISFTAPWN